MGKKLGYYSPQARGVHRYLQPFGGGIGNTAISMERRRLQCCTVAAVQTGSPLVRDPLWACSPGGLRNGGPQAVKLQESFPAPLRGAPAFPDASGQALHCLVSIRRAGGSDPPWGRLAWQELAAPTAWLNWRLMAEIQVPRRRQEPCPDAGSVPRMGFSSLKTTCQAWP